jgi:replicative DNA helicase
MMLTRDEFDKLYRSIPQHVLDDGTKVILEDFKKYYKEFDVERIEQEPFWTWFKNFGHPKLSDERKVYFEAVLQKVQEPLDDRLRLGLHERLVAADTASKLTDLLERFGEGEEVDIGPALRNLVEQYEFDTVRKIKTPFVEIDIDAELAAVDQDVGFHWRQPQLNEAMRPLTGGDFGILAARPDVGKTTLLTDAVTFFAPQVDKLYPGEGRHILWFNNEGPGKRIVTRSYQSALNAPYSDLVARSKAGTIRQDYLDALGGRDVLKVLDVHDFYSHDIEDIIRSFPPALIIFDMVDNIKFGGLANNNGQRTDQLLEAMYQWARVLAVKHDCPVLATSQISADGAELAFPLLHMLKDSKTGKQGAADFIMTIGFQSASPDNRYLGLTKNKLAREGGPKRLEANVIFDGQRGRYVTPTLVAG